MRCSNCGYEIPSGMLYCKRCGQEIRIVPDYNPLDDMLATQVRASFDNNKSDYINDRAGNQRNVSRNTTRTGNTTRTKNTSGKNQKRTLDDREARRRQAERRREIKRKKRRRLLIIMFVIFLAIIGATILLYQNSYIGIVNKANKALLASEYADAQENFEKAIDKDPKQAEAYIGLSQVYIAKGNITDAEKVYLDVISKYSNNVEIYKAFVQFYLDTNQALKIPKLLSKSSNKVREAMDEYIIDKPKYSLEAGKVYDDVQQLTLESDEEVIYYTIDGTEPSFSSTKYTEPIQLDEGETVIKAFAVNKKGVPGLPESKTYVIELPIEDAPAVSPSTGQYDDNMKIEIKVPEGYTAYYTMDGSTPTTASTKYTGPINMPENDTLFKAILVNSGGRVSGVTTRNYILEISDEEE